MMLRLACLFSLLTGPALADALDRLLASSWGSPTAAYLSCQDNAKQPQLAAPALLRFHYATGIWFPADTWTKTLDYRILERGEDWLLLSIPNEFRTFNDAPIIWRLRFTGPDRFVWLIEGSEDRIGDNPQVRCGGPSPSAEAPCHASFFAAPPVALPLPLLPFNRLGPMSLTLSPAAGG